MLRDTLRTAYRLRNIATQVGRHYFITPPLDHEERMRRYRTMLEWLDENGVRREWIPETNSYLLVFDNPKDAAPFKLRWLS